MRVTKTPEERRAELIAAARHLFDVQGVEKTRVSDIVREVGVAQGVFYYYFSSKNEMVSAVLSQVNEEIKTAADAILADQNRDFCDKLSGFVALYLSLIDQFLADNETSLRSLRAKALEESSVTSKGVSILTAGLLALIRQGAERGDLTIAFPEQMALTLLYGLRELAADELPDTKTICTIVEQGLHLPKGKVYKNLKKENKE